MAQALLFVSGVAAPCPCTLHLVCTPSQPHGNYASIGNAAVLSRSKFVPDRRLPCLSGNLLRSRGNSLRRSRLLAFAELQEAVSTAEQPLSSITSSPLSSETQLNDATSSGRQTLDSSPPSLGTFDAPGPNTGTGPELNIPEPNSGALLPSVDATVTETLPAESAAASNLSILESAGTGPDALPGAGESAGNSVEITPLQRYEALINRANGGARKPVAVDEDGASFTFPTSITDAQESVTKTITDIQQAINDSIGSAGKAVRDVYDNINGSIKGSVNSVTGLYDKTLDDVQTSVYLCIYGRRPLDLNWVTRYKSKSV